MNDLNTLTREQIIEQLAVTYYRFVTNLPFDDDLYMKAIDEGRRKFLANLHIYLSTQGLPNKDRRYATDLITPSALAIIQSINKPTSLNGLGLQYEHVVPRAYIQESCETKAINGTLTLDFVQDILHRYLWTATVTEGEHRQLKRQTMPDNWDGVSITARYDAVGVPLLNHDKTYS